MTKNQDHVRSFDKGVRFACNVILEYAHKKDINKEDLVQLCTILRNRVEKEISCKLN